MDLIEQRLAVREWPLRQPGDKHVFGHIAAVGIYAGAGDRLVGYADFTMGESYVRYKLPMDLVCAEELLEIFSLQLAMAVGLGIGGNMIVIERTKRGHRVDSVPNSYKGANG